MQTIKLRFFYVFLALMPGLGLAQVTQEDGAIPNSLRPAVENRRPSYGKVKPVKFRKPKVQHTAQYEFYARVEKAAREKQKILKELSKPQYSDPRYFGHKRIPKRRPAWKMRYCPECGIRH